MRHFLNTKFHIKKKLTNNFPLNKFLSVNISLCYNIIESKFIYLLESLFWYNESEFKNYLTQLAMRKNARLI